MSFARSVKKEIATFQGSIEEEKALIYGYTKLKGEIVISSKESTLEMSTTSLSITRRIISAFKKVYNANIEVISKTINKLNNQTSYLVILKDNMQLILTDLDISDNGYYLNDEMSRKYDEFKKLVITGMFLAKGSINDPSKSNYHLELVCSNSYESDYVVTALAFYGIEAKMIIRKKGYVVYIKKSVDIGDFLKLVGANQEMFYFENMRIKRDTNNQVNRMYNCDIANGNRTVEAAQKQIAAIKKIEAAIGYNSLSTRLMEAVILRTSYPYYTLQELSEVSEDVIDRYLSKSGIAHCMKEIEEIAEKL